MSVLSAKPRGSTVPAGAHRPPTRRRAATIVAPALVALAAFLLALGDHAVHLHGMLVLLRGTAAGLVVFGICGDALAQALVPRAWWPLTGVFALVLGATASGIALMAFGVAHVPLHVSLWLTLALGLVASVAVRRRGLGERGLGEREHGERGLGEREHGRDLWAGAGRARVLLPWLAALVVVFAVGVLPAGRYGDATVFGENPDASQVVGIAVLFQHAPPTATDVALPLDTVPPEWRFRYPIFYPLAAAANLSHLDPIRVFPGLVGLLVVICAFGFAMLAVDALRAPPAAGPAIAGVVALGWVVNMLAWHPYWNQLWGLALFPYVLLFGWRWLREGGSRAGALTLLTLLMLWLAYPLALPYPLVILAALAFAYPRRLHLRRPGTPRAWVGAVLVLLVLLPAVIGAVEKLEEAISQLLSPGSALWGGDVTSFTPFGNFVGTGGGIVPALCVAALGAWGLSALPRRVAIALGGVIAALCLLDLRFRLVSSGTYMDFKHLSFVGPLVLVLAATAVARMLSGRRRVLLALGVVLALVWTGAAVPHDVRLAQGIGEQVTPEMLQIRQWAAKLPPGASVRVDIPAKPLGGFQLWAVFMLGDHPVDAPRPVVRTTYAHAPFGLRADYSLSFSHDPLLAGAPDHPAFTVGPPLFRNSMFQLMRIRWPRRFDYIPDTASRRLVTS